ncbi:MAG: hypothetical protein WC378_00530 [Opitutaceae bacterium]|jgi:hypothetical protein
MHSLRLRSYAERRRMIDQMGGPECIQIHTLHRVCLARKESLMFAARSSEEESCIMDIGAVKIPE